MSHGDISEFAALAKNRRYTHRARVKKCLRSIAIRAQADGALHSRIIENRMAAAKKANWRLRARMSIIIPRLVTAR